MDPRPGDPSVRRSRTAALAGVVLLVTGCSYAAEEPGLLDRRAPTREDARPAPPPRPTPPPTDPELPVLAERTWTTADGSQVEVRLALHAVRRVDRGTVLDWSVTPVATPNLQPGDPLPAIDLGLARADDDRPRMVLLEPAGGRVHRPLSAPGGPPGCVCTPVPAAAAALRVGHTTLLQVAFGELPARVRSVDVVLATVAPYVGVPVTPVGRLPVAASQVQLARPAPAQPRPGERPGERSAMFRAGPDDQVFRIESGQLLSTATGSAWTWTIRSVTGGPGPADVGDPFGRPAVTGLGGDPATAAGAPELVVQVRGGEQRLQPRTVSPERDGDPAECLCSPLTGWTAWLQRPDKPATVVTLYPPLPAGAGQVRVRLPGVGDLALRPEPAAAVRDRVAGDRPWPVRTWRAADLRGAPPWTPRSWPTPVPAGQELPTTPPVPARVLS